MLDYFIKQIVTWPGTRNISPRQSAFKMDWARSLQELEKEIGYLGGTDVVFRLDLNSINDVRRDGKLVQGRKVATPAVIVEFKAEGVEGHPRLAYPCDTFSELKANIRAVAGILEALRTVDRYGGKTGGRQYAGFKALPSNDSSSMTAEIAVKIVADAAGVHQNGILTDPSIAKEVIRRAIGRTHPDRNAGDRTAYDLVERARTVLTTHHGVSL